MRLENERFCVEIAELGAELTRVYDKKAELDILWEGDPAFWKRHSPVLFPNVTALPVELRRIHNLEKGF